jgi:hypothetical protein
MLDRLGRVAAADDVQPLLHVALVLELRRLPVPVASKNALRSNSSNSPALAMASSSSGIW